LSIVETTGFSHIFYKTCVFGQILSPIFENRLSDALQDQTGDSMDVKRCPYTLWPNWGSIKAYHRQSISCKRCAPESCSVDYEAQ